MNMKNYSIRILLATVAVLVSCSDWTEMESIKLNEPDITIQNPELYAKYVEKLLAYKQRPHQVTIVSVDNKETAPVCRNEQLTDLPDSVDYICLNHIDKVSDMNKNEIAEVHKKGTKVVALLDFDQIEAAWKAILREESNDEANQEFKSTNTVDGDVELEEDEATRFINYCQKETNRLLALCNEVRVDGIEMNYTGVDLNVLTTQEAIAAETARQGAFFDAIVAWKASLDKILILKGMPQNVINKDILLECKYLIINAHSVKTREEMSYRVMMASAPGVPTDRFILGVTTPYKNESGAINGELSDGSSAIVAAGQWAVVQSDCYTKAGISIDAAQEDYFNADKIYIHICEAINIMNPTIK